MFSYLVLPSRVILFYLYMCAAIGASEHRLSPPTAKGCPEFAARCWRPSLHAEKPFDRRKRSLRHGQILPYSAVSQVQDPRTGALLRILDAPRHSGDGQLVRRPAGRRQQRHIDAVHRHGRSLQESPERRRNIPQDADSRPMSDTRAS